MAFDRERERENSVVSLLSGMNTPVRKCLINITFDCWLLRVIQARGDFYSSPEMFSLKLTSSKVHFCTVMRNLCTVQLSLDNITPLQFQI